MTAEEGTRMLTTRLNRPWLLKTMIFLIVLVGFGAWGLFDALVAYPSRGENDASWKLRDYLQKAREAKGALSVTAVAVPDPGKTLSELAGKREELISKKGARQADFELAQYEWLTSLKSMWRLSPVRTNPSDPNHPAEGEKSLKDPAKTLELLTQKLKNSTAPVPLSAYDMLMQWSFVAVGFGGALWLLILLARVASRTYRYDPATHQLTTPEGKTIAPDDLAEVDKRRWHKFYVTLNLTSKESVTLDLYRFYPLEAWVLEMETIKFPETAPPADDAAPAEAPPA